MIEIDQTGGVAIKIKNIPMPPSVNKAYKNVGKFRALSKDGAEWYRNFLTEMKLLNAKRMDHDKLIIGSEFYFRHAKKSDLDNYTKLLWDGLKKAGIILDDNQFFWHCGSKQQVPKNEKPYVNLTIMSLGVKFHAK